MYVISPLGYVYTVLVAFRVDDTKIKLPGAVNGTETELSHMAFFAKAVDWEALVL